MLCFGQLHSSAWVSIADSRQQVTMHCCSPAQVCHVLTRGKKPCFVMPVRPMHAQLFLCGGNGIHRGSPVMLVIQSNTCSALGLPLALMNPSCIGNSLEDISSAAAMRAPVLLVEAVQAGLERVRHHVGAHFDAAQGWVFGRQLHGLPEPRLERLHRRRRRLGGASSPRPGLRCLALLWLHLAHHDTFEPCCPGEGDTTR